MRAGKITMDVISLLTVISSHTFFLKISISFVFNH